MSKKYREVDYLANTLDLCVLRLLEYKKNGQMVKFNFNGHWLYSDTVTMDGAYLECTGRNKADFDKYQE